MSWAIRWRTPTLVETAGFTINFAGTEEPKSTSIPGGNYPARIFKLEFGQTGPESKNPGEASLKVEFRISSGDHEGRPLFRNFTFGEKAKPYFLTFCKATGKFSDEQLTGKKNISAREIQALQGAEIIVKVSQKRDDKFGMDDGFKNEVRGFFSKDSEVGKTALAAVRRDPLAPGS